MIELRLYQQKIIDQIRKAITELHKIICICAPTGAGKTVIFSYIVSNALFKNKRCLILTNRTELLFETGGTLYDFGIKEGYITAGQRFPPQSKDCYVAMAQTLKNRIGKKSWNKFFNSFDIIIIDEAHLQDYNDFFEKNSFGNNPLILGFTATPKRTGKQRQLAEDYTKLIAGPTTKELIKLGFLVPDRYFGVPGVELTGLRKNSKGDYAEGEMFQRFNKTSLYDGAIEAWTKHAPNTITLGFCVSIQHVIETTKKFNEAGIKAKFVVSDVAKPKLQDNPTDAQTVKYDIKLQEYNNYIEAYKRYSGGREHVLKQWKNGEFKVLFNAGILTTGFNYKPIETIIMNRATVSDNLWLQMIGRGSRISEGKTHFNILDLGENGKRLGYYQEPREYSLIHERKQSEGAAPVRECGKQKRPNMKENPETGYTPDKNGKPGCGSYFATATMICPFCGYIFESEKELIKVELEEIKYMNIDFEEEKKFDSFKKLERTQEERGYKFGWLINQLILENGEEGLNNYAKYKGYNVSWIKLTAQRYKKQIEMFNEKNNVEI